MQQNTEKQLDLSQTLSPLQKIYQHLQELIQCLDSQLKFPHANKNQLKQIIKNLKKITLDQEGTFIQAIQQKATQLHKITNDNITLKINNLFNEIDKYQSPNLQDSIQSPLKKKTKTQIENVKQQNSVNDESDKLSEYSEPEIGKGLLKGQDFDRLQNKVAGALNAQQLEQFDREGYIIIENILNQQEIIEGIGEIWDVLETMPQQENKKVQYPNIQKQNLIQQQDQNEQIQYIQNSLFSEPRLYHTRTHWKLRQNPQLYNIFSQLLGTNQLWCSIDNTEIQLPEQSAQTVKQASPQSSNSQSVVPHFNKIKDFQQKIEGIVNLTERTFLCVPGSNQSKWQKQYRVKYGDQNQSQQQSDFSSDQTEIDPWDLGQVLSSQKDCLGNYLQKAKTQFGCTREIKCPQGSIILFHNRTMRTLISNQTSKIIYGYLLSFFPAGNRELMAVYNNTQWKGWNNQFQPAHQGDTEISDRLRSYYSNSAPYRMSNGNIIQYPKINKKKKIKNKKQLNQLKAIKSNEQLHQQQESQQQLQIQNTETKGQSNNEDEDIIQKKFKYSPPLLTDLGKQLLGIQEYEGMKKQDLSLTIDQLQVLEKNGIINDIKLSTTEEDEEEKSDKLKSGEYIFNNSVNSEKIEDVNSKEEELQIAINGNDSKVNQDHQKEDDNKAQ